jgi:hypothetical protein
MPAQRNSSRQTESPAREIWYPTVVYRDELCQFLLNALAVQVDLRFREAA